MRQDTFRDGTEGVVNPNENIVRLVFDPSGPILINSANNGSISMGIPLMYQSVEMFMLSVVSVMRQ